MPEIEMPEGRYFSLSGMIRAGTGGQTRALLMRNRILTQRAGVETTLTTFDVSPIYPEVRASLEEQGQLVPGMNLVNIYEWYRENPGAPAEPIADALPVPEGFVPKDEMHPDGTVYRTKYLHKRSGEEAIHDYRRPDGTVYLRTPAGASQDSTPASEWVLCDTTSRPTHRWPKRNGWHKLWLRTLAGDAERVFVISDSRFALAYVIPMRDPRFHVLHLMHNTHTVGARHWNSTLSGHYAPLLNSIRRLDGLVTLTHRQREDVVARYGETNNLFVVPNPVDLPQLPAETREREPATFAVVSRLERQKRLDHAIRAFALVLEQEPHAKLDIYGDGNLRVPLQELIDELGVGKQVVLRGHSPAARDNLLTATAFLMTSGYEGYPLASLESMSLGCPVVSYDIKYGPREQITDGVDGYLVDANDQQAFADRLVTMIRDPELVARMSKAALVKAEQHDYRAFLRDWRAVIERAIANKPDRVRFEGATLDVRRLGEARAPRLPRRLVPGRSWSTPFRKAPLVEVDAGVDLRGKAKPDTLEHVKVSLDAVCDKTSSIVPVPATVRRHGRRFDVRARFDASEIFEALGADAGDARLRLRVIWNNASWEQTLARPRQHRPPFELSYTAEGELLMLRGDA